MYLQVLLKSNVTKEDLENGKYDIIFFSLESLLGEHHDLKEQSFEGDFN